MKYEMIGGEKIAKIGFGMYGIGGGSFADSGKDAVSRAALRSALSLGYTHFDTAEVYAGGHSEKLLGGIIKETGADRANLFITTKVDPMHLAFENVLKACEGSLKRLQMDYVDLYLIHWPNLLIKLDETFRALNKLVSDGMVKHLGVSNFNLKRLKCAKELSATPLFADQVPYRLPDKGYVMNGVLDYCQKNDVLLTAYTPIKFRNLNVNPTIRKIAAAHSASSYQIALAWLTMQPRVITIPASLNPAHQKDNLQAADIDLSAEEMAQLDSLYS
jgi:diketogulonate reductase-like aldo/keto reductase